MIVKGILAVLAVVITISLIGFSVAIQRAVPAAEAEEPGRPLPASAGTKPNDIRYIRITDEQGLRVIISLNDSQAARDLYRQLPLSVDGGEYSTNEKIFYPPAPLRTDHTPQADGAIGTVAYYRPWGDVALFFDTYRQNKELYELGHVAEGLDQLHRLSGTLQIEPAEQTAR